MIAASAPGKLMLAGEYVVLERKLQAVAVAVQRRLRVEIVPGPGPWRVTASQLGLSEAALDSVPVLREVVRRVAGRIDGGRITVESELGAGPGKPGLGASAALCVAAYGALSMIEGAIVPGPGGPLPLLLEAHRAAQGGRGSGYDVATSLTGGLVMFDPTTLAVTPLAWPRGLHAAVFTCGQGAKTVDYIARVESWREEDPESFEACVDPFANETEDLVRAFQKGDVAWILGAAAQVQEELGTFDRIGELGILAAGQHQLLGAIEDAGAVGRTSGAGGGDSVWALADDADTLDRATKAAAELGFQRVDVAFPGEGLRVGANA